MSVASCLLKHFGQNSPVAAYRADMAEDVAELVADGMTADAAWVQVTQAKLDELSAERARIERVVADAYAETPAGKTAPVKAEKTSKATESEWKSDAPIRQPAPAATSAVEATPDAKPERDPVKIELRKRESVLQSLLECLTT